MLPSLLFFQVSCSKPDEVTKEEENPKEVQCYLLKYGISVVDTDGNKAYPMEFEYEGDRIIKRLHYFLFPSGFNGGSQKVLSKTEHIHYNNQGLPVKISENNNTSMEIVEEIFYNGLNRMIRKQKTTITLSTKAKVVHDTYYTYDNLDRINSYTTNVHNFFTGETRVFNSTVTYDQDGNLSEITEDVMINQYAYRKVTTYSNYDSYKNALANINVPFDDYLLTRYSKNNCRKVVSVVYDNGQPTGTGSQSTISYGLYNEYGYPMIGEYRCE